MNNVKTINSSVRTLLIVCACGVVGYFGYFAYETYIKPSQEAKQAIADLATLKSDFEKQQSELQESKKQLGAVSKKLDTANELNERLAISMKLLKVDKRIANIKVLSTEKDEDGNPLMNVSFTEVNPDGDEVGISKNYTVKGTKFYVDGWIVAFEDKYIEQADELRGASLFVFKSIYGDGEAPRDAQRLDDDSQDRPGIYNDDKKSDFEQKIWSDFWGVSNDTHRQQELGIRASHGQTTYILGQEGKTYQVEIRASGSMGIKIVNEP